MNSFPKSTQQGTFVVCRAAPQLDKASDTQSHSSWGFPSYVTNHPPRSHAGDQQTALGV